MLSSTILMDYLRKISLPTPLPVIRTDKSVGATCKATSMARSNSGSAYDAKSLFYLLNILFCHKMNLQTAKIKSITGWNIKNNKFI